MSDPLLKYGLLIAAGIILGVVFFGGLWLTVQAMQRSRRPGLLFVSSAVLRTAFVLAGFWYCASGDALSIAACLTGFVAIRVAAIRGAAVSLPERKLHESN